VCVCVCLQHTQMFELGSLSVSPVLNPISLEPIWNEKSTHGPRDHNSSVDVFTVRCCIG